jgi:hypothetical protein
MNSNHFSVLEKVLFTILLAVAANTAVAGEYLPNRAYLFTHSGYNYVPSVIDDGVTEKFWWCGYGTATNENGRKTDVIYYTTYSWSDGEWGPIVQVLAPDGGTWNESSQQGSTWEWAFTCDPSVIQGVFVNPDDGASYSYAMYYTATNTTVAAGTRNSIGVAYSNDGINWVKYSKNPVITQQDSSKVDVYGAGQAATYNYDGKSGLYLFYTDDTTSYGNRVWLRSTTDGIHFGTPTLISNTSSDGVALCPNDDFAYDWKTGYFYGAIESCDFQRSGERVHYQFGLYRIAGADLLKGQGAWEPLGYVNSAMTGFSVNHSPGLRRDGFGNSTAWLPLVSIYFAGGTDDPSTWNLSTVGWVPSPNTFALNRYAQYPYGHWVSTGYVDPGYTLEMTLGYLYMTRMPGTRPIYSCQLLDGIHHFLSMDQGCESQVPLGVAGWIYLAPPQDVNTVPIYRCNSANGDHFASTDPKCEGTTVENEGNPLGYARTSP